MFHAMASEADRDDLKWALDRQKSDYSAIQKQVRRYLILLVTVAVVRGLAWYQGGNLLPDPFLSTSLATNGFFWQLDIAGPRSAEFVTQTVRRLAVVPSVLGFALLAWSLYDAFSIERAPRCLPLGNAESVLSDSVEEPNNWVEENDTLLSELEERRERVLALATKGTWLLLLSFGVELFVSFSSFGAAILCAYSIIYSLTIVDDDSILYKPREAAVIRLVSSFYLLLSPLAVYQNVFGYLSPALRLFLLIVVLALISYWQREKIAGQLHQII